jgi:SAM-dependent methyltransferase
MRLNSEQEGLKWQVGVWDQMSHTYVQELDRRFAPVVEALLNRASLRPGESVLDVGSGTGAAAVQAAVLIGPAGKLLGIDISPEMVTLAGQMAATLGLQHVDFRQGLAEVIPAADASFDVVLASLSMMYVIDRAAAAREIARVLRPAGRFVAAVWAGPQSSDIVLFQQTAGSFAPSPPVPDVGPGALADPKSLLAQLADAGVEAKVETEVLDFEFAGFESAWNVLAGVTAAQLAPERREEAKAAVRSVMWPHGDGPRRFRNATHFIVGNRRSGSDT